MGDIENKGCSIREEAKCHIAILARYIIRWLVQSEVIGAAGVGACRVHPLRSGGHAVENVEGPTGKAYKYRC